MQAGRNRGPRCRSVRGVWHELPAGFEPAIDAGEQMTGQEEVDERVLLDREPDG